MSTPYIGFENNTLDKLSSVKKGDMVFCKNCGGEHPLECCIDESGVESDSLMYYKCGEKTFLGAIDGKCTASKKADCSGRIGL